MTAILLGLAALGLALLALYVSALRAITVADLAIEGGRVRVIRGGLAPRVLSDLGDVAARTPAISRGHIRITRHRGRAAVAISGDVPADRAQAIRNVIGTVRLEKLAAARKRV